MVLNACAPTTNGKADDVYSDVCGEANVVEQCMGCDPDYFAQATVRSMHVGGVFVGMCDGSVQFISEDIEAGIPFGECCTPWDRMIASGDSDGQGPFNGLRRGGCRNFP